MVGGDWSLSIVLHYHPRALEQDGGSRSYDVDASNSISKDGDNYAVDRPQQANLSTTLTRDCWVRLAGNKVRPNSPTKLHHFDALPLWCPSNDPPQSQIMAMHAVNKNDKTAMRCEACAQYVNNSNSVNSVNDIKTIVCTSCVNLTQTDYLSPSSSLSSDSNDSQPPTPPPRQSSNDATIGRDYGNFETLRKGQSQNNERYSGTVTG